jgi:hypothetical protein
MNSIRILAAGLLLMTVLGAVGCSKKAGGVATGAAEAPATLTPEQEAGEKAIQKQMKPQ